MFFNSMKDPQILLFTLSTSPKRRPGLLLHPFISGIRYIRVFVINVIIIFMYDPVHLGYIIIIIIMIMYDP